MSILEDRYEVVVGLEIHAQLSTLSKIYSPDSAEYGGSPNTHVSVITLGHPGTLPVLNEKAVEFALKMGFAVNCHIRHENQFARKNYFYADLPKGYQITQHTTPICYEGYLDIKMKDGLVRRIGITRIHIEEDAGKSIHDQNLHDSLIDLNRAGVPLIEIVSEPDLRSAEEAGVYLTEIRKLLRYLDICDGNMEEGSMRCDANISVRPKGAKEYGNRCEVKNLNSIRNVQRAIEHEAQRQVEVLEAGGRIDQNTLNFDALTGNTSVLRSKEMSNDYRYFPEPDLPPLVLSDSFIAGVKAAMPLLHDALYAIFVNEYKISGAEAITLLDRREIAMYFMEMCKHTNNAKAAFNWLMGPVKSYMNEQATDITEFPLKPAGLAAIIALVDDGKVNNTLAAQQILPIMIANPSFDPLEIAIREGLLIEADSTELNGYILQAIEKFADKVLEYQHGKKGLTGLFMGEVMKLSKGKVDPKTVSKLLTDALDSYKL